MSKRALKYGDLNPRNNKRQKTDNNSLTVLHGYPINDSNIYNDDEQPKTPLISLVLEKDIKNYFIFNDDDDGSDDDNKNNDDGSDDDDDDNKNNDDGNDDDNKNNDDGSDDDDDDNKNNDDGNDDDNKNNDDINKISKKLFFDNCLDDNSDKDDNKDDINNCGNHESKRICKMKRKADWKSVLDVGDHDLILCIIEFIAIRDLLNIYLANKEFYNIVNTSIEIRDKFDLSDIKNTTDEFDKLRNGDKHIVVAESLIEIILTNKKLSLDNKILLFKYVYIRDYDSLLKIFHNLMKMDIDKEKRKYVIKEIMGFLLKYAFFVYKNNNYGGKSCCGPWIMPNLELLKKTVGIAEKEGYKEECIKYAIKNRYKYKKFWNLYM
jgi:hypothetical protein